MNTRNGIYIASRTKYAPTWLRLRAEGVPIISTWIDEAGDGHTVDYDDLWRRCFLEATTAERLVLFTTPDEPLKGALMEMGAALSAGVPVIIVGKNQSLEKFRRLSSVRFVDTIEEALTTAAREKEQG